ncbi:MAG: choice-of-anchor N protein [Thermodesulfobacteriota bacterium]
MKRLKTIFAGAVLLLMAPASSYAIPTLQLYIEGSTYDAVDESWSISSSAFTLWILGETDKNGTIYDVNLSIAHLTDETGSVSFTPTTATAGLLPSPGDSSTPVAAVHNGSGSGTVPLTGDGTPLPSHGIYGPGTDWDTYLLGDFSLTDSPIGNYTRGDDLCPGDDCTWPAMGQINAYDVAVTGYSWVQFDAFDHVISEVTTKYIKAPFSHDAETTSVPEPNALILLGSGFLGLWALKKKLF